MEICGSARNLHLYAWIPQLVEGAVHTRFVAGSSPAPGTNVCRWMFYRVHGLVVLFLVANIPSVRVGEKRFSGLREEAGVSPRTAVERVNAEWSGKP